MRIDPKRPRRRDLLTRLLYRVGRKPMGELLAPIEAWAHSRPAALGYGALEAGIERTKLDPKLRELAFLKAGAIAGCEWCMDIGSELARRDGVSERQLMELPRHRDSDAFDDRERLVLDYATAMTVTPVAVDDALVERLRAHFSDREVVELTAAIAVENLRARFNWALGIESQNFSEGSFCVRPEIVQGASS